MVLNIHIYIYFFSNTLFLLLEELLIAKFFKKDLY